MTNGEHVAFHRIRQALAIAILMAAGAPCIAATPADYTWTDSRVPNVSTVNWSKADVGSFLARIYSAVPVTVGDFRFSDLLDDGNIELIASVDYSGRWLFNHLLIVRRTDNIFG